LILWVKDQSKPLGPEEIALQESMVEAKAPVIRVFTHQDLAKDPTLDFANWDLSFDLTTPDASRLGALSDLMIERTLQAEYLNDESTLVTSSRHRQALMEAQAHIQSAIQGLDQSLPGDLIAIDLRGAIQQFGLITGAISNEDVLDSIFSRFCIGK
ncbi:MAG TPA: tRNA uridine-5-carboxymethylaminomethyl(34) synthesis GTPase MnmE, partial [Bacteroidetes bacterium]|nr:tRNA uridine-5-carboxymethylaminomethyl(34) synthesis GTPase MnmE [Bacteroidota bacterium]